MADRKLAYAASTTYTITLASLASSSTLVAGQESTSVSNTTNLYLDYEISGKITVGTTPTINTRIEIWVVPKAEDGSWPDVFDGTDSAETVTSRTAGLLACAHLLDVIDVDATTSNRTYWFKKSMLRQLGYIPAEHALFIVHNTGVALNSTGSNHAIYRKPVYETV